MLFIDFRWLMKPLLTNITFVLAMPWSTKLELYTYVRYVCIVVTIQRCILGEMKIAFSTQRHKFQACCSNFFKIFFCNFFKKKKKPFAMSNAWCFTYLVQGTTTRVNFLINGCPPEGLFMPAIVLSLSSSLVGFANI